MSFTLLKVSCFGKRDFNIQQSESSSGTPAYYINVKKNANVYFGFVQINRSDDKETGEEINTGKYNPKEMKGHFKTYNETLDKRKIYLTDKKGSIRKTEDCGSVFEMGNGSYTSESILYL